MRYTQAATLLIALLLAHAPGSETPEIGAHRIPPNLSLAKIHASGYIIDAVEPTKKSGWTISFGSVNSATGELIINEPYMTFTGNKKSAINGTITCIISGGFTGYRKYSDGILADIEVTIVSTTLNDETDISDTKINHHQLKVRVTKESSGAQTIAEIISEP